MIEKLNSTSIDFSDVVRQLKKNFSLSESGFPDRLRHQNISVLWLEEFGHVLRSKFYQEKSKLFQLLCRIDIDEKELIMAALFEDGESELEKSFVNLAKMIFYREQIKVHYRMNNK